MNENTSHTYEQDEEQYHRSVWVELAVQHLPSSGGVVYSLSSRTTKSKPRRSIGILNFLAKFCWAPAEEGERERELQLTEYPMTECRLHAGLILWLGREGLYAVQWALVHAYQWERPVWRRSQRSRKQWEVHCRTSPVGSTEYPWNSDNYNFLLFACINVPPTCMHSECFNTYNTKIL